MERQEKGGSTYFFLALVTLAFLAAVLYLTFGANRTEQEGYTVQTERPAREEVAPERVLVNINTATAEELETLARLAQITPPDARAALRRELLAQLPAQRTAWLRARLQQ